MEGSLESLRRGAPAVAGRLAPAVTLPVGRFLIDLPEGASPAFGRQGFNEAGGFIRTLPVAGPEAAWAQVEAQADAVDRPHEEGGSQLVRVARGLRPHSWFVYFWKDTAFKDATVQVLGYFWRDGLLSVFPGECRAEPGAMVRQAARLDAMFGRMRRRAPLEIPAEPGFCLRGGYFPGPPAPASDEHIELVVKFPGRPGMSLRFCTDTVGELAAWHPSLLEREGVGSQVRRNRAGSRLRARDLVVGSFVGQELVERTGPAMAWRFAWECPGRPRDPLSPLMALEMRVAPGTAPAVAEPEAFRIWDGVLGSLRRGENSRNSLRLPDGFRSSWTM